jgi:hypothetical protein
MLLGATLDKDGCGTIREKFRTCSRGRVAAMAQFRKLLASRRIMEGLI